MKQILALSITLALLCTCVLGAQSAPEKIRIAIIDTGISPRAIAPEHWMLGHNYMLPEEDTTDKVGHGTAIAGIIVGSAVAEIEGVYPDGILVPLIYTSANAQGELVKGTSDIVAQAIYDAVEVYGCRVINISSGAFLQSDLLRDAVAYAQRQGVVVVSSAGNNGGEAVLYPGGYEQVISVGALNATADGAASFSQHNDSVDLLAAGDALQVAGIQGNTLRASGTSFSTAYVSAAAASLLGQYPQLTPQQVEHLLCASATDLGQAGYDTHSGWGALNIPAAFAWASQGRWFRDVAPADWYFSAINTAREAGLLSGVSRVEFAPNAPLTRAMAWTMLARMQGKGIPVAQPWYAPAQAWAIEAGVSDGSGAQESVTREQLLVMLWRSYGSPPPQQEGVLAAFVDGGDISPWARQAMAWGIERGAIAGVEQRLNPQGAATRGQAAVILPSFLTQ